MLLGNIGLKLKIFQLQIELPRTFDRETSIVLLDFASSSLLSVSS